MERVEEHREPLIWALLNPGVSLTYKALDSVDTYTILEKEDEFVKVRKEEVYNIEKEINYLLFSKKREIECKNIQTFKIDKYGKISNFQHIHKENEAITSTVGYKPTYTDLWINPTGLRRGDIVRINDILATVVGAGEMEGREVISLLYPKKVITDLYEFDFSVIYNYDMRTGLLLETKDIKGRTIRRLESMSLERL